MIDFEKSHKTSLTNNKGIICLIITIFFFFFIPKGVGYS